MAPKRQLSPSPQPPHHQLAQPTPSSTNNSTATDPPPHAIYRSKPIHDRSSTFLAVFSPTAPASLLRADPSFAGAHHRIAAWRVPSAQTSLLRSTTTSTTAPAAVAASSASAASASSSTPAAVAATPRILTTGFDDDGEAHAGKKVLRVLDASRAEGSVVVARWWGGVMLGPVRFAHIEAAARDAIGRWRKASGADGGGGDGGGGTGEDAQGSPAKKHRVDGDGGDARRGAELLAELPRRDESVAALRALLAEKKAAGAGGRAGGTAEGAVTSPAPRPPDYARMPLAALERLERARDATIAFLLKSIDEAEKEVGGVRDEGTKDGSGEGGEGGGKSKGVDIGDGGVKRDDDDGEDEVTDPG